MGSAGATCFKTLSGETRDIEKEQWDQERFGQICSSADTFANWKKAILKLCRLSRRCSYDAKKKLIQFGDHVETYQLKLQELPHE